MAIPPGEEEKEDATQHDRCTVTQDQRKCNNSIEPWLRGGKVPTVHKTQRRGRGRREGLRGGGGNSITSASSFTGQRDREPEL